MKSLFTHALLSVCWLLGLSQANALTVDEALEASQKTGRPILAVAGSNT